MARFVDMGTSSPDVGSQLLEYVRSQLGDRCLGYAHEPRRLTRGMFAEVWQFSLANGPPGWSRDLVLRVYPGDADRTQVHVEAAIQNGLVDAGFPAPEVLLAEESDRALGRPFVIMERVPGRTALRGLRWDRFLRDLPRLTRTWPSALAQAAARLHSCPIGGIETEAARRGLASSMLGWDRHLRLLERRMSLRSVPGWTEALRWLRSHHPPEPPVPVVVHGDLWPANLLYQDSELTGVVDWDRATLGDPALDIGFAKAGWALMPAPTRVPPPAYQALRRLGRSVADRIEHEYSALVPLDPGRVRYYEALRCAVELAAVVERRSRPRGVDAAPGWEGGANALADYFEEVAGTRLQTRPR